MAFSQKGLHQHWVLMTEQEKSDQRGAMADTISEIETLLRQGKPDRAEALLVKESKAEPHNFDVLRLLGVACVQQRKHEEAAGFFEKALTIEPNSAPTHYNLGITLSVLKDYDEAINHIRRALEIEPDDADAHAGLGGLLVTIDQHEEAIVSLRRAVEINPDDALGHIKLGMTLQTLQHHEEALSSFRGALEIRPDDASIHNILGIALNNLMRSEEAVLSFQRAVEIRPDHPVANKNLGAALIFLDRSDEAISYLQRAVENAPDDAEAHNNLGIALNRSGQHEDGLSSSRRAIEINPESASAHMTLASCLSAVGNSKEAASAYETALGLCDSPEQKAECLYRLSELPKSTIAIDLLKSIDEVKSHELGGSKPEIMEDCQNRLAFARAQALENRGSYEQAWDGFVDANRELNSLYANDHEKNVKRNQAALSAALSWKVGERQTDAAAANIPISLFILGPSRSGKSSLEKLVGCLNGTKCGFESAMFSDIVRHASAGVEFANLEELCRLPKELVREVSQAYLKELSGSVGDAKVFTNTSPAHIRDVGWISESVPSVRFVFVNRNREDTALRIFMKRFRKQTHHYAYDLDKIFEYLSWYQRMADAWMEKLPGNMMHISYEDMIANPEETLASVAQFCGLDSPTDMVPRLAGDVGCSEHYRKFLAMDG